MITVQIDETTLLDMLVDRVEYWTDDRDIIELYQEYYNNLIEAGCFEGGTLDIAAIVDNDYVNYTQAMTSDDLKSQYNIDVKDTDNNYYDRVLEAMPKKDLYLVQTY